jgi:beta-lactamase regulating signal transducer with metallopeptidase domain
MTGMTDRWVISGLMLLADWSVRWGLILVALAAWFALRPPRRAATRHRLCAAALAASLLLPLAPKWANATVSWPSPAPAPVTRNVPPQVAHEAPVEDVDDRRSGEMTRPVVVAYPARDAASRPDVPPRSSRLGPWRIAALVVAGAWASVALALLVRLAAGRLVLARFRRGARPVGSESERLLDDCRRALGLKRPAALAAHPAVRSPLTLGGRRPLVLVPPDWCGWPEPDRRACLLHELAHLVRHDDRAKLVQELVRAPFAFHPLVLWLLARLDRERELLCDEAVVALGADPVSYARLLLDLARRPGRLLPDTPVSSRLAPLPGPPHRRGPHRATPGGRHATDPLPPVSGAFRLRRCPCAGRRSRRRGAARAGRLSPAAGRRNEANSPGVLSRSGAPDEPDTPGREASPACRHESGASGVGGHGPRR